MGLDMYLIRKRKNIKEAIENYDWYPDDEIAYWRKANQIHKWFVDNIQDGNDDCGYYEVKKEDLQELVDICNRIIRETKLIDGKVLSREYYENGEHIKEYEIGKVIDNQKLCEELLPSQSGFFFGGTDYDEWYFNDIEYTKNRLEAIIQLLEWDLYDVYYGSSW